MAEGDFGVQLPMTVSGVTFDAGDEVKLIIKTAKNGTPIIEKTFSNISENTINFELTEEESALLPPGTYFYLLDWYEEGVFLCNVLPEATLKVVDKV